MVGDDTRSFLVRALRGGDGARNALLERIRPRLVLWAATRLSPALRAHVEPEDVAQEVLIRAHRGLDTFVGEDDRSFLAWLFTIAENQIRDMADRAGAQKRQVAERPQHSQTSPSGRLARTESAARVLKALDLLAEDYRQVIQLRRLEEQDVAHVAQIMGRSENAVRVLYCRALQALRAAILADGETSEG